MDRSLAVRIIGFALGAFLLADGAVLSVCSNFNAGSALVMLVGIFFLVCGIYAKKICSVQKRAHRVLRAAAALCICAAAVFCAFLFIYGTRDTVSYNEDVVIVLGTGVNGETPTEPLKARLDTALEYISKNSGAAVLVTGGQGPQEDITEAEAMTRYLEERGVPREKILREDRSTSTSENFKFSKPIIDKYYTNAKAAVITNEFHIYRSKAIAAKAGFEVTTLSAPTPWYSAPAAYMRELLAVVKLWLLGY